MRESGTESRASSTTFRAALWAFERRGASQDLLMVVRLVSFGGGVFQEPLCRLDGVDGIHPLDLAPL